MAILWTINPKNKRDDLFDSSLDGSVVVAAAKRNDVRWCIHPGVRSLSDWVQALRMAGSIREYTAGGNVLTTMNGVHAETPTATSEEILAWMKVTSTSYGFRVPSGSTEVHDFNDGAGSVSAEQNLNYDGTVGGWVADSATVSLCSYIGPQAKVYGKAKVTRRSSIGDQASLWDNACVSNRSNLNNFVEMWGDSLLKDGSSAWMRVWLSGDVEVSNGVSLVEGHHTTGTIRN